MDGEGPKEGSGEAAKTDNRIGASRSPLTSLVPGPKRDFVVTALSRSRSEDSETLGLGPRSRMWRCRGPTSRRQLGPIQTLSCFSEAGIPALWAGRCRKKRAVERWWGCATEAKGAGEGSGDAAKTDNRIGASRSPLTSLVPGPKRDLVVTAQPIPIRRFRDSWTGAAFPHVPMSWTLFKEISI